jgi:hypothetical protein
MAACRWNCGKLSEIAQLRSMYRRSSLGNGLIRDVSLYQCWGTAMERLVMRPLTSVLVVFILAVAPVTVASAQVSNSSPASRQTGGVLQQQDPALAAPSPPPDLSILNGRIPGPLPVPSPSTSVNGPVTQQDLTSPLPVQPSLTPPSVAQPGPVPSVFQSQTGL